MAAAAAIAVLCSIAFLWHLGAGFSPLGDPQGGDIFARARRYYARQVWAATWACSAAMLLLYLSGAPPVVLVALAMLGQLVALSAARNRLEGAGQQQPGTGQNLTAPETGFAPTFRKSRLVLLSLPVWALGALVAYTWHHFEDLPERMPVHWGLRGPDRWTERTPGFVFGMLLAMTFLATAMGLLALLTYGSERQGLAGRADEWTRKLLVFLEYSFAGLAGAMLFGERWPVRTAYLMLAWGILIMGLTLAVVATAISARSRNQEGRVASSSFMDACACRAIDDGWKWAGAIYYNPQDPAILVPKRRGLGWTLNFARWQSWLVMAFLLVPVLLLLLLAR